MTTIEDCQQLVGKYVVIDVEDTDGKFLLYGLLIQVDVPNTFPEPNIFTVSSSGMAAVRTYISNINSIRGA